MTNNEFLKYISTIEYQEKLTSYINSKSILMVLITSVIFIPVLYKVFKKFYDDETSCVYMLDFNDGVIERKYNNKGYGIGTVGMYLTIDDVTINFEPTRLETTGWKPCKSR